MKNPLNKELLAKSFEEKFGEKPAQFFDCGGRFEILGNHTDHNHGLCIVGTCDLSIKVAVTKREDKFIYLVSEGHVDVCIDINDLTLAKGELGTSAGIVKGVVRYLRDAGYNYGGFMAYMTSDISTGVGVSSSAAFELILAEIENQLFNEGKIDKIVLCKAGQYSENYYYNKKSGLLDQIGVAFGGMNLIDFGNIDQPNVVHLDFPFEDVHFILVNPGGSHSHLSANYSSIPESMEKVSEHFGKKYLRDVGEKAFLEELEEEKEHGHSHFDNIDKHRAIHFFEENRRVLMALKAIKEGDEATFFKAINESQHSSQNNLFNTQVEGHYEGSPQEAIDYANALLKDGACKINGGGFMGSIICFVKTSEVEFFMSKMKKRYGEHNVIELELRKEGPIER